MQFTVKFKGTDGRWSVEAKRREIGLKEVRAIREVLEVDLPLERIQGFCDSLHKDPVIVVSEEQANQANDLFLRKNTIVVKGERGFLNHHAHPQVECSRNEKTGEIEEASLFPKIWEEAVLEEWFSMGCPLEWPNGVKPETEAETD